MGFVKSGIKKLGNTVSGQQSMASTIDPNRDKNMQILQNQQTRLLTPRGPSAAQLQMNQGLGQAINAQVALAKSRTGGNTGIGARNAAMNIAGAQGDVNAQSGILRAQEIAQNEGLIQQYVSMGLGIDEAQYMAQLDRAKSNAAGKAKFTQTLMDKASEGASAAAMSDMNQKTDIKDGSGSTKSFLDAIRPYAYKYKDASIPGTAPGQRFGVMAQDLEKSDIGKTIVFDSPEGKKLDVSQGFGVTLASLAELNKRLSKLEKE